MSWRIPRTYRYSIQAQRLRAVNLGIADDHFHFLWLVWEHMSKQAHLNTFWLFSSSLALTCLMGTWPGTWWNEKCCVIGSEISPIARILVKMPKLCIDHIFFYLKPPEHIIEFLHIHILFMSKYFFFTKHSFIPHIHKNFGLFIQILHPSFMYSKTSPHKEHRS